MWLIILLVLLKSVDAQQTYNENDQLGYSCSIGASSCQAYAIYRATPPYDNLRSIGTLFSLSVEQITAVNDNRLVEPIGGQMLMIPLNCSCVNGRSQYNTPYIIEKGDTYAIVSNATFQGLTTWQAVNVSNPNSIPTLLQPGDRIIFPVRCSCPTPAQKTQGVKSLLTYAIFPGDGITEIASTWNISVKSITDENVPSSGSLDPQLFTTLLLPMNRDPPRIPVQLTPVTPAPPAPRPNSTAPATNAGGSDNGGGSSNTVGIAAGVAGGVVAAVGLVCLCAFVWLRRRRRRKSRITMKEDSKTGSALYESNSYEFTSKQSNLSSSKGFSERDLVEMADLVESERRTVFSYEELSEATNGFSHSHLIQGSVYKGVLRGQLVVMKQMKGTSSQEIKILCKVHHSNLIKLVGFCNGLEHLFLVYEFAENGSLSDCLHHSPPLSSSSSSSSASFLSWTRRLRIAVDVATGLEYIHDYTKPSFVHKDLKSSNILLDGAFRAKIANFGMARLSNTTMVTRHVDGTQGYMAPEYLGLGIVSPKVDVYAFGVVMLELLTGREATMKKGNREMYLATVITEVMKEGEEGLKTWVDDEVEAAWECVLSFAKLGISCVNVDPEKRPAMKDVTYALSKLSETSSHVQAR